MILNALTIFHVALSLVGIGSGVVAIYDLLKAKTPGRWTQVFLTFPDSAARCAAVVRGDRSSSRDRKAATGLVHFARTDKDAVIVQISGYGPTDTRYFNPAGEPRPAQ
jgi:hypothetical protein